MAITNFLPNVWSEALYLELDKQYVAVKNCARDFEGVIRGKGDTVNISSVGEVSIFDYTKNTDMSAPQNVSEASKILTIDQAKAFNFQIDDIDRAQQNPKIMQTAMRNAAQALSNCADAYVFELFTEADLNNILTFTYVKPETILDCLIDAKQKLLSNGVGANVETVLEVTPAVAAFLLKSKILQTDGQSAALENGCIGKFVGFEVYVSNHVVTEMKMHKCFARTKTAIAFAEQLSEINAYRPEKRFADAVKGLHLYGAKLVKPKELVILDISLDYDAQN